MAWIGDTKHENETAIEAARAKSRAKAQEAEALYQQKIAAAEAVSRATEAAVFEAMQAQTAAGALESRGISTALLGRTHQPKVASEANAGDTTPREFESATLKAEAVKREYTEAQVALEASERRRVEEAPESVGVIGQHSVGTEGDTEMSVALKAKDEAIAHLTDTLEAF